MKKVLAILTFFALFFPLIAVCGIIEQRCFSDQFGDLYLFSGGKLDKKAYAIKADTVACGGEVAGLATFAKLADGSYFMWGFISGNYSTCVPFEMAASFNSLLTSGSGNFDTFPRNGTPDGALTFTPISCALVPMPNKPVKRDIPAGQFPGKPTE
jgi:hypothetical protein